MNTKSKSPKSKNQKTKKNKQETERREKPVPVKKDKIHTSLSDATAALLKEKKPKKTSANKYSEIQNNYSKLLTRKDDLVDEKDSIEKIIKTGIVYLPSPKEGEKPIEKKLTTAEVSGYRKKLQECKLELKKAKSRLKKAETTFKEVSRRNATAAKNQITTINRRYEQKRNKKESRKYKIRCHGYGRKTF